jgi:hypothetical protein
MVESRNALVIGTEVATNGLESGGSLRVDTIRTMIEKAGIKVTVTSKSKAKNFLESDWDLIVVVSFSCSRSLLQARSKTSNLWFDPTDSWRLSRLSLLRAGQISQLLKLFRDLFWLSRSPNVDLLTFISQRDALAEQNWWQSRINPLILPVFELNRKVLQGESFRLVFVGDGKYVANRKSLDFLEEVLHYLPPSYEIHLFGDSLKYSNPRFKSHGYVSKSELYRTHDIHLVPVKFGSGLKLKAAVPLWNGLPVVATVEGANGLSLSCSLFVGNTPKEFAKEILVAQNSADSFLLNPPKETVFVDNNLAEITTWLQTL